MQKRNIMLVMMRTHLCLYLAIIEVNHKALLTFDGGRLSLTALLLQNFLKIFFIKCLQHKEKPYLNNSVHRHTRLTVTQ